MVKIHNSCNMLNYEHETVEKYRLIDDKVFMSLREAEVLSRSLAEMVMAKNIPVDKIIGIANGAILPATIIAEYLSLPLDMEKIRRKGSGIKRRLERLPYLREFISIMYRLRVSRAMLKTIMN